MFRHRHDHDGEKALVEKVRKRAAVLAPLGGAGRHRDRRHPVRGRLGAGDPRDHDDTFIVFAANAFALLGLRPLFFLVADLVDRLYYLKTALAALLIFIGAKLARPSSSARSGRRQPARDRRDPRDGRGRLARAGAAVVEGADRNRTGVNGFAGRCVATPPRRRSRYRLASRSERWYERISAADDRHAAGRGAGARGCRSAGVGGEAGALRRQALPDGRAERQVRLYVVRDREGNRRLHGCWRSTGRKLLVAADYDDGYVTSGAYRDVVLAGRFVAFVYEATDISCKAACPPDYDATHDQVTIRESRAAQPLRALRRGAALAAAVGRRGRGVAGAGRGRRRGARDRRRRPRPAVDTGAIDAVTLTLRGPRLEWVNAGAPKSEALTPF